MNRLRTLSAQLVRQGLLLWLIATAGAAVAQNVSVSGTVSDAGGMPLPGVAVMVPGTTTGTVTDFDGKYNISVDRNGRLLFSFIGFESDTVDVAGRTVIDVRLYEEMQNLSDVVVVGYGTQRKKDLTGSITSVSSDDFNGGLVSSPEQLISGKVAGVQIMQSNGSPTSGSTIRIRGGASLNASNDPLIVLDGVPLEIGGISGNSNNFMSLINPNDIESMTVLKDASSTAIYGSRASNGVIIITTKKGRANMAPKFSYNGNVSVSMKTETLDVLDGNEYREFIKSYYGEDSDAAKLLGTANTDWQDEIYRTAVSHDHNLTVQGGVGSMPYRVSLGYTNQEGILETSKFERVTANLNLNPALFEDHLKFNVNAKLMYAKNNYANTDAIGAAARMDPTQEIRSDNPDFANFKGYFTWTDKGTALNDPKWPLTANSNAVSNPLALLNEKDDRADSYDYMGNLEIDYKIHGLEDLRLHMNFSGD